MIDKAHYGRAERGHSRIEYYTHSATEEFGLNKRARRIKKGQFVTKPDGSADAWMTNRLRGK